MYRTVDGLSIKILYSIKMNVQKASTLDNSNPVPVPKRIYMQLRSYQIKLSNVHIIGLRCLSSSLCHYNLIKTLCTGNTFLWTVMPGRTHARYICTHSPQKYCAFSSWRTVRPRKTLSQPINMTYRRYIFLIGVVSVGF